jgi:hypothetical protein
LFQENNCNPPHGIAYRPKKNGSVSETFARDERHDGPDRFNA